MKETTVKTEWTCDVCGKQDSTKHYGRPDGWMDVKLTNKGISSHTLKEFEVAIFDGIICDICSSGLITHHCALQSKANKTWFERMFFKMGGRK